jgi:uncharacterized membrane protein
MPKGQHQLEHQVHRTLLGGLVASAVLLVAGTIAMLVQGNATADPLQPLGDLLRRAMHLNGPALTTLGLLVLMITPILRVVVLLAGWAMQRDWVFASVAVTVLILLIVSLSLGVG